MASGKFRLRVEPYDPDAIDADGDGIVQEGTAWERPGNTRIVDNFLNEISRGMTATSRSSQFRVVDRSGRPVRYTPTYQRGGAQTQISGPTAKPISKLGPSLKERGLRPIGDGSTLNDRFEAAQAAAASASSIRASDQARAEIEQAVDQASQSLSLRRSTMLADVLTPEEAKFQAQLDAQAKQLLNQERLSRIDRGTAETLVLSGTYWATFLFGGGQLGSIINDITTGVGDAGIQEQVSLLSEMLIVGGAVGLKAALTGARERYGIAKEQIDQFVDRFAERMKAAGVKFQDVRKEVAEAVERTMQNLGALMRMGPNKDSVKPAVQEVAEAAQRAAEVSADTQRILDRNAEIADRIAELGGSVTGDVDDAFREKNAPNALGHIKLETKAEAYARRRERIINDFAEIRQAIKNGGAPTDTSDIGINQGDGITHGSTKGKITPQMFQGISPEVRELVMTKTDDELLEIMEKRAIEFQKGLDKRVRVNVGNTGLLKIFEDGRYKTTHEAKSEHSGPQIRSKYEVHLGIPADAPAELRPASGYVSHPDWERLQVQHVKAGMPTTSDDDIKRNLYTGMTLNPNGHVGIYGGIEILLRPEVSGRTRYGRGDSLTTALQPVSMDSSDPTEIMHALSWSGGNTDDESVKFAAAMLQTDIDGHFGNLNLYHPRFADDGTRDISNIQRGYFEALIGGSFDVGDIDTVRVPTSELELIGKADDDLQEETVFAGLANPDKLRAMGFTDEEIAYIISKKDSYMFKGWFQDYVNWKRRERGKQKLDALGANIEYIRDIGGGVDPFELSSYRDSDGSTSIDDVMIKRSRKNIADFMAASQRRQAIDAGLIIEDEEESVA